MAFSVITILFGLLFITIADFTIEDLDDVGTFVLLVLIIVWFVFGGFFEWWVWGKHHRREVKDLQERLKKTEQRLRIMETLAIRGTDIADRLVPEEEDNDESV